MVTETLDAALFGENIITTLQHALQKLIIPFDDDNDEVRIIIKSIEDTYKIMAVLKVKIDIITSIDASGNVCRDLQNWHYCFYR